MKFLLGLGLKDAMRFEKSLSPRSRMKVSKTWIKLSSTNLNRSCIDLPKVSKLTRSSTAP